MSLLRDVRELLHNLEWYGQGRTPWRPRDGSGDIEEGVGAAAYMAREAKRILFVGNGGSYAIGAHMAIDWTMNGGVPALCFADPAALTAVSNDFGFDYVFSKQIERHGLPTDVLFAISSSGRSPDILNAVAFAAEKGMKIITFSGFDKDNPLRQDGDINFYVPSRDYGPVECSHLVLNHAILNAAVGLKSG